MANTLFEKALKAEGITGQLAEVARSIYMQESGGGKNTKTSNAGAHGGMQIVPSTFKNVADKGWDINDPMHNARAGIRYLAQLSDKAKGDPTLTAVGYYGGPGAMDKARKGIAVSDPRNPKAPNTLQYAQQVVSRIKNTSPLALPDDAMPDAPPQMSDMQIAKATPVKNAPAMPVQQAVAAIPAPQMGAGMGTQVAAAHVAAQANPWDALNKALSQRVIRPADLNYGNQMAENAVAEPAPVFEGEEDNSTMVAQVLKKFGIGRYAPELESYRASVQPFAASDEMLG